MSKISAKDVAKAMFVVDFKFNSGKKTEQKPEEIYEVIENDEMIKLSKEN